MNKTISVIIPTYNRAEQLRRCLTSLVEQSFKDFEVIVCDDGSTDHTKSVVNEFREKLDIIYNLNNNFGGPAKPRNIGIQIARGKYLAFLDSDDWWLTDKLQVSFNHLEMGNDIVFHDLWIIRSEKQMNYRKRMRSYQPDRKNIFADLLIRGNALPMSSVVIRADLIRNAEGFSIDKDLISTEDFDAWLRIATLTNSFKRVNGVYGYYWMGGGNITESANDKQAKRYRYLYNLHINKLAKNERRKAEGMLAYMCARVYQKSGDLKTAKELLKYSLFTTSMEYRIKSFLLLTDLFIKNK